jgi:hypothetical protein
VAGVVADSSILLEYLAQRPVEYLEEAVISETLVLPPLVIAEVISGDMTPEQRTMLGELLQGSPLHVTAATAA